MSDLHIERNGDTWDLAFGPPIQIGMQFRSPKRSSEGLHMAVLIASERPTNRGRVIGPIKLNLYSTTSQRALAVACSKRVPEVSWDDIVPRACSVVADSFDQPTPTVVLDGTRPARTFEQLVPPLVPLGETTFIYGDSESCKSLLGQRIALSVQTGHPLPWGAAPSRTGRVLILDWETSAAVIERRLRALAAGMGIELPPMLYRGAIDDGDGNHGPLGMLEDELQDLRAQVNREKIDFILVDSIGFAVRGKLVDDDVARAAMADLRRLGPATRLVVAHISKGSALQEKGRVDPFGSAFFRAGIRSGFEVRRAEGDGRPGATDIGIYHWKSNDARHADPFGMRVTFQTRPDVITFEPQALEDNEDLDERSGLPMQIRAYLLNRGAADTHVLAVSLNAKEGSVRRTMARMYKRGVVVQLRPAVGGERALWGLAAEPG